MSFEDFQQQNIQYWIDNYVMSATARVVWDAATAAERQRCREIAEKYEKSAIAYRISKEIGE